MQRRYLHYLHQFALFEFNASVILRRKSGEYDDNDKQQKTKIEMMLKRDAACSPSYVGFPTHLLLLLLFYFFLFVCFFFLSFISMFQMNFIAKIL